MFGRSITKEYAEVIKEIDEGKRRQPQHDHPQHARGRCGGSVDPVEEYFFDEIKLLGPCIDLDTDPKWCLEETSDTVLQALWRDQPDYGRRWNIYYNALKVGWLEAYATPNTLLGSVDEFVAAPQAAFDLQIDYARWIPDEHVYGFLTQASMMMQDTTDGYDPARLRASHEAVRAMTLYNWEVQRAADEYVPTLNHSARGTYAVYRKRVAHWKVTGFDVFAGLREER